MAHGTTLAVQLANRSGVASVAATTTASMMFANDGSVVLEVINGATVSTAVTITQALKVDGVATAGLVVTVPASSTVEIGPFPPNVYNQVAGSTDPGFVYIDITPITTVTIRAVSR